jgi:protease-4
MNGLLEIQTTNKWLIDYDFGIKAMRIVNAMANGHLLTNQGKKVYGERCYMQADGTFALHTKSGDMEVRNADGYTEIRSNDTEGRGNNNQNEPFINVLFLDGPITREGGACTYGSRQLRDMMMEAADTKGCLGHLLLINGPGGVSNAIPDFQQATDYARSKGQPIVGRIDGRCASAHIWISAMCDEVYYNLPTDQIGSIGIYWAGILNKDGDTDPETGGKWHIVYDPASYDKNRFARDLAESDDDTLIKEELIADGKVFRDYIKSRRPNVKDEHLHGKMFDAKDVEGIFVTGQATMQETFNRIAELSAKRSRQTARSGRMTAAQAKENVLSPTNNSINMKENYPAVFALLGVEEMQLSEEGTFFNKDLLATLNSAIEAKNKETADAKALAEQLTSEKNELTAQIETLNADHQKAIDDLKAEHAQAVETLNADHQKAIDDLKAEHATAIEEKDNQISALEQEKADLTAAATTKDEEIATLKADAEGKASQIEQLNADLNGAKESLTTAEGTIAERDQTISDLNTQIAELQHDPGQGAQAGAAPQNNGGGAEVPEMVIGSYVYNPDLSYEKNLEAERIWNKEHGIEK